MTTAEKRAAVAWDAMWATLMAEGVYAGDELRALQDEMADADHPHECPKVLAALNRFMLDVIRAAERNGYERAARHIIEMHNAHRRCATRADLVATLE